MASTKDNEWTGRWSGRIVVCIASGPSLTAEDCELVRAAGHPAIVTNTTFRLCPWAEVLLGHDAKWWQLYRAEVERTFAGQRVTCSSMSVGAKTLRPIPQVAAFNNSGAAAVALAVYGAAARVVMLGYDCQFADDGRVHWHGDHPPQLGNARSVAVWPAKFQRVATYARQQRVPVMNASRVTALKCFERVALSNAI